MAKVRRIDITIETHEITRIRKGRSHSGDDAPEPDLAGDPLLFENTYGPDLILFSENNPELEVSNPTPLAVDDRSHIPGKALNG